MCTWNLFCRPCFLHFFFFFLHFSFLFVCVCLVMRCHAQRCWNQKSIESSLWFGHIGWCISGMCSQFSACISCTIHADQYGWPIHGEPIIGRQSSAVFHHTNFLQLIHRWHEPVSKILKYFLYGVCLLCASGKCIFGGYFLLSVFRWRKLNGLRKTYCDGAKFWYFLRTNF